MEYTFFITTTSSVSTEVHPLNWLECSLVWEKENDNVFYRQKFEGSLTFGGKKLCADFNYFYSFETTDPCEVLYLTIYKDGVIYWEGYLSTSMGEWDLDAQTFTVTPLTLDGYADWEKEGNKEYDILALPRVDTIYDDGGATTTYDRTILLSAVIEYLAQQTFSPALTWGVSILSEFLTNATNPITGSTNKYNYLTISQKSDIIYPTSSNPATKGNMSWNQLAEILKCMNLRWEYDEDLNVLTIEHISEWESVATLDIRTIEMAFSTNKYRRITEEMPKYEYFKWMEAYNVDFVGEPIWYDSYCVNQDPDSNSTEFALPVTTDIQFIRDCITNSEEAKISKDGWVLFSTYLDTDYYINVNAGILDPGEAYFNADLSWGRLHNAFFKHDRQLIEGYMNDTLTTFYSAKKTKQQECSIVYCSTFNPELNITTELGETYFSGEKGDVRKAVIKPYGEINLTLLYGPAEEEIVPIPDQKIIRIVESGICGELHATLSPAADDDLDLYIGYEILDEFGVFVCGEAAGATPVWTIPNGATTADFTVSFDDPGCGGGIPAGGCWNPVTDYLDAEGKGWTVFAIIQDPDCSC